MESQPATFAVRARYLFPVSAPPVPGGVLTIRDGRIAAVGENLSGAPTHDLGNVAIVPGLVNAHSHLEFSALTAPLGAAGMPFAEWLREVVRYRRETVGQSSDPDAMRQEAVALGLSESLSAGVAAVGEIATLPWPAELFQGHPQAVVFLELLGLRSEHAEPLWDRATEHLVAAAGQTGWLPGISPHAPYTVPFELFQRVCKLSSQTGVPLAMHVAETAEELELLASHSGPLVEFLSEFNVWNPAAVPRGIRPLDYLRELATAARALVVHGNYLTEPELAFLGEHRDRLSLIYCPRTHAYFGHMSYPLTKALALGVRVALGTDSRASNPDLCVLSEMRHVANAFPEVSPADVLKMGTLGCAIALGLDDEFGSLSTGKRASLCLVPLPDAASADPHELLFGSEQQPQVLLHPEHLLGNVRPTV